MRKGERHARAPEQPVAEQQFLPALVFSAGFQNTTILSKVLIDRGDFDQLNGSLAPASGGAGFGFDP